MAEESPPVIKLATVSLMESLFLNTFCKCSSPSKKKPASIILKIIADVTDKNILKRFIYKIIIKFYKIFYDLIENNIKNQVKDLVGVSKTSHTTHNAKDVVVSGVNTDLSGLGSTNSSGRNDKLKSSVINS